jgi:hypothetical protein
MESRFDTLAKLLASGMSRREALRQLSGTAAGVVLAALGIGCRDDDVVGPVRPTGMEGPLLQRGGGGGQSACAQFCKNLPPGRARGECVSAAAHGAGLCVECGGDFNRVCTGVPSGRMFCCDPGRCCPTADSCCPPGEVCGPTGCEAQVACHRGAIECPPSQGGACCPESPGFGFDVECGGETGCQLCRVDDQGEKVCVPFDVPCRGTLPCLRVESGVIVVDCCAPEQICRGTFDPNVPGGRCSV